MKWAMGYEFFPLPPHEKDREATEYVFVTSEHCSRSCSNFHDIHDSSYILLILKVEELQKPIARGVQLSRRQ